MKELTAEFNKSLTAPQLAERWQCHIATILRRQDEGLLKGFKLGIRYRFPLSEVLRAEQMMIETPARRRFKGDHREKLLKALVLARSARKQKLTRKAAVQTKVAAKQKAAASLKA
jgi:hypothetical protein